MSALLDQQSVNQIVRRFERGVLRKTLQLADVQLRSRGMGGSPGQPTAADEVSSSDSLDAAELMTKLTLYGVELPSQTQRVSAGCIEAMRYLRDQIAHARPAVLLDWKSLSILAAFFGNSEELDRLLAGKATPNEPSLRLLLEEWGPAFVLCVQALGSRWPALAALESAPGNAGASTSNGGQVDTAPWTEELNSRRCELIDRRIQEVISPEEDEELDQLQELLRRHLDKVAPIPLEGAKRLHAQLLRKAVGE
jgi:hypothetical protein